MPEQVDHVYSLRRARGDGAVIEGYRVHNVLASYVHAHWASNPGVAAAVADRCARSRPRTSGCRAECAWGIERSSAIPPCPTIREDGMMDSDTLESLSR
jgi:hypothetical protein